MPILPSFLQTNKIGIRSTAEMNQGHLHLRTRSSSPLHLEESGFADQAAKYDIIEPSVLVLYSICFLTDFRQSRDDHTVSRRSLRLEGFESTPTI